MMRPAAATGIEPLDDVLRAGLPIGAISEMVGPECSGRTSVALSFLAQATKAGKVCCWIDVANTFDPASAAAIGVDLTRLLWVRCGVVQTRVQRDARNFVLAEKYLIPSPHKKGLHGGGFGPHPRSEVNFGSQKDPSARWDFGDQEGLWVTHISLIHAPITLAVSTGRCNTI
jgi:recombination protein RecA